MIRLMQQEDLVARVRRRYRPTAVAPNEQPLPANVLDRQFDASSPNKKWVGDTTELITPSGKLYLAAIVDLYSRFVVGWAMGDGAFGWGAERTARGRCAETCRRWFGTLTD